MQVMSILAVRVECKVASWHADGLEQGRGGFRSSIRPQCIHSPGRTGYANGTGVGFARSETIRSPSCTKLNPGETHSLLATPEANPRSAMELPGLFAIDWRASLVYYRSSCTHLATTTMSTSCAISSCVALWRARFAQLTVLLPDGPFCPYSIGWCAGISPQGRAALRQSPQSILTWSFLARGKEYPMNGAESLVRTLLGAGIATCFANPGTSEMHFVAALDQVPGM